MPNGHELITEFPIKENIPSVLGVSGHGNAGLFEAPYNVESNISLVPARSKQTSAPHGRY